MSAGGEVDIRLAEIADGMHGPAFTGDCRGALLALADDFDQRVARNRL